jgi:predicted permease
MRAFLSRLLGTMRSRDSDLDEEIQAHLDLLTEEHITHGMSPDAARRAAIRSFGGVAQTREAYREQHRLPVFDGFARDLRVAVRTSVTKPWFAVVVIATFAMGIAATVAITTVLDQVVLRPLPYPEPTRLVRIESPVPGVRPDAVWNISTAEYFYFRQAARTLEQIGIYVTTGGTLAAASDVPGTTAERVTNGLVSVEVFGLLGIKPVLGRLFTQSESGYNQMRERPSAVILSYHVWQSHFGGSPDVIGRTIVFEERALPIVGVLGPDAAIPETAFARGGDIAIWMPLGLDPNAPAVNQHTFRAIARLRSGATVRAAQAELDALTIRLPELYPTAYSLSFMEQSRFATSVAPLRDNLLGSAGRMLWVLVAAIVIVFAIAATNIANLFLVRAETRTRERNVRMALGATRLHLVRHALAESLLLCLVAAVIALPLASVALHTLIALAPATIPRLAGVHLDWVGVIIAAAAALLAAITFAAFATLRADSADGSGLRQHVMTASRRQQRIRQALVVAQVALALTLAAGATLMAFTVQHLLRVDPGFDSTGVVSLGVMLPRSRYSIEQRVADYHNELAMALRSDPDIIAVGAANSMPLDGNDGCTAVFIEDPSPGSARRGACVDTPRVTTGYFSAMGIQVRGRVPAWNDSTGVVVSEALARRLWPDEAPIGKGIRVNGNGAPYYRVVGVAVDVRRTGLDRPVAESVYFPIVSLVGAPLFGPPSGMRIVIRSGTGDFRTVVARVRTAITNIDSTVPIGNVQILSDVLERSMAQTSFTTALLGVAALLAIALSAIGLYGVVSYAVVCRQNELSIRLALGARPSSLRAMVIRETLILVTLGVGLGVPASLLSSHVLSGLVFGIGPRDPATLAGLSLLLIVVGLAACLPPAWRAGRVDPMVALKCN